MFIFLCCHGLPSKINLLKIVLYKKIRSFTWFIFVIFRFGFMLIQRLLFCLDRTRRWHVEACVCVCRRRNKNLNAMCVRARSLLYFLSFLCPFSCLPRECLASQWTIFSSRFFCPIEKQFIWSTFMPAPCPSRTYMCSRGRTRGEREKWKKV